MAEGEVNEVPSSYRNGTNFDNEYAENGLEDDQQFSDPDDYDDDVSDTGKPC